MPTASKVDSDLIGGDMGQLMTNNYQQEYIQRAQVMDIVYQDYRSKHKRRVGEVNGQLYDTNANRKRVETNQKKLRVLQMHDKRPENHTPMINPPMKRSLYDQEYIKKYLQNQALLEE
jgi:hypothetical protein